MTTGILQRILGRETDDNNVEPAAAIGSGDNEDSGDRNELKEMAELGDLTSSPETHQNNRDPKAGSGQDSVDLTTESTTPVNQSMALGGSEKRPRSKTPEEDIQDRGNAKSQKSIGVWNWLPAECVALVASVMAASEQGETYTEKMEDRLVSAYLKYAKELVRLGIWDKKRAKASSGYVAPEESARVRTKTPSAMWSKGLDLRKTVQMRIAPHYRDVVGEEHSGWGEDEVLMEARKRYV